MNKYIKREDAIKEIMSLIEMPEDDFNEGVRTSAKVVYDLPVADVVEVVRCEQCKHQSKGSNECESWNLCEYRSWLYVPTNDDDFCSHAERKQE